MAVTDQDVALEIKGLKVYFFTQRGVGKAVDGVDLTLRKGETLGLVGESGCGKTITALTTIGLHPKPAARVVGGEVILQGENLLAKSAGELTLYRGKRISLIPQDPMTSLNPVFSIFNQISEPLKSHLQLKGPTLKERAIELLHLLRIPSAEQRLSAFPHQLSGGMRQRVVGAIALSCNPEVVIADEPTTSLDVTVQAAYLALLKELQQKTDMAILFITHDFGVVARMCDRVAVMYAGRVVETASTWELFDKPAHPYSEALMKSVPDVRLGTKRLTFIDGQPPSIYEIPKGCPFASRCQYVMPHCREEYPPKTLIGEGHEVSCWRCE